MDLYFCVILTIFTDFWKISEFCLRILKIQKQCNFGAKTKFFQIFFESLKPSSWSTRNSWICIFVLFLKIFKDFCKISEFCLSTPRIQKKCNFGPKIKFFHIFSESVRNLAAGVIEIHRFAFFCDF